jgi:hypothetical protein
MSINILAPLRRTYSWSVSSGALFRAGVVALLFFMLPLAANAYTLVLRSGRSVNVSDKFKVTRAAITYEASPGYWVTVWLSNVDIAATEKANSEPAGSFTKRIKQEPEAAPAAEARAPEALQVRRGGDRKVITNKDLERARLTREAQEEEYERTRLERGMPSRQEMRQRIEEHDRWLSEWAQRMQEERMEAELESLRSELVNVRLQLSELGLSQQEAIEARAYALPNYYPYFYAPSAITVLPFGHRGLHGRGKFGRYTHGRSWSYLPQPYQLRTGRPFARIIRPLRGKGALLRATPRRMSAPGRMR